MTTTHLSEKVRELIQKARIVSFATWHEAYPPEVIRRFQAADDQSRYLSNEDSHQIQTLAPNLEASLAVAQTLRDQASFIVDEARATVLKTFPAITDPRGGLYPEVRANACWRDFWHFLRCIAYGIAGQRADYTSREGLQNMRLLYQELAVPLDAMVVGLEGVKQASLARLENSALELDPYFDHLIAQLRQFRN